MQKVRSIYLFRNGMIAAFDEDDQQIPALQEQSALEMLGEKANNTGYNLEGAKYCWPDGSEHVVIKRPDGSYTTEGI
jgi:hypothetical protein